MKQITSSALWLMTLSATAQTILPNSLPIAANEPSAEQAFAAALPSLRVLTNLSFQANSAKMAIREAQNKRRYWSIRVSTYEIQLYCNNQKVRMFTNLGRLDEHYRNQNRTGIRKFASEQTMRTHLRKIATDLGIPTSTTIKRVTIRDDKDAVDSTTKGVFGAHFYNSNGKIVATLNCDIQDGTVLHFLQY